MSKFTKTLNDLVSVKFNEGLLIEALENIFSLKDVSIEDVACFDSESRKGDNYLSTISRFTVKANGKSESGESKQIVLPVIAKFLPNCVGRNKTFRIHDFFKNEAIFYNTVWKAIDDFQKSRISQGVFTELPICVSAFADGTNDYVVLEDLSVRGYASKQRSTLLDFDHAKLILKLFAKFHALSLAFKDQKPELFELIANSLEETYVAEKLRNWNEMFQKKTILTVVRDAVEKQLSSFYLNKFDELLATDFYGTLAKCCSVRGPLAVVTHGDAWLPNFLLKYDEETKVPIKAIMIDFQLARYTSLANDVTFFLYSCADQQLRLKYWDILVEGYFKTVRQTLKTLGSHPELITYEALKNEIKKNAVFGLYMGLEGIIMSVLEDDETVDLDVIQEGSPLESVWIVRPFKSEEKRQRLADVIKHAIDNGFI